MSIPVAASVCLLFSALYTDLSWQKIPNYLTLSAMAVGFWFYGTHSVPNQNINFALQGILTGFAVLILPFMLGGTGGGDVKLFMALGALLGSHDIFIIFLYTAIIGGVISLFLLLKQKKIMAVKDIIYDFNLLFFNRGQRITSKKSGYIPYSVPTALGFLVYAIHGGLF